MYYSQHTLGYKDIKLGYCTDSLWQSACFLTSFCNWLKEQGILDVSPDWMNQYFKKNGLWGNSCLINGSLIANHFNLDYKKVFVDPKCLCIAETNYYAKVAPQHFFLFKEGERVDPLDAAPDWEKNNYPIVSYRVFSIRETPVVALDKPIDTVVPPIIAQDVPNVKSEVSVPIEPAQMQDQIETHPVETITAVNLVDITLLKRFIEWLISFFKK